MLFYFLTCVQKSKSPPGRLRDLPGFTLLETMIVLVIITILALFSFPSLQNYLLHTEEKMTASQFLHLIDIAKQKAEITQRAVGFGLYDKQKAIVFYDDYGDGKVHEDNQLIMQIALPKKGEIKLRAFPYYRDYLLFKAQGNLQNDNAALWYCYQQKPRWVIFLNQSGRKRLMTTNSEMTLACSPT